MKPRLIEDREAQRSGLRLSRGFGGGAPIMVALAAAIVCARVAFRLLGMDEHAAVVAGMPISNASWLLGPLAVVLSLASVIVTPVLVIGAVLTRKLQ